MVQKVRKKVIYRDSRPAVFKSGAKEVSLKKKGV